MPKVKLPQNFFQIFVMDVTVSGHSMLPCKLYIWVYIIYLNTLKINCYGFIFISLVLLKYILHSWRYYRRSDLLKIWCVCLNEFMFICLRNDKSILSKYLYQSGKFVHFSFVRSLCYKKTHLVMHLNRLKKIVCWLMFSRNCPVKMKAIELRWSRYS